MNERELIDVISRLAGSAPEGLLRGIGDDCAVFEKQHGRVFLVTMDTLAETVHFDLSWQPPEKLGRKSVSVNISDIAAMGGVPVFVLLSLGLPSGFDEGCLTRFLHGFSEACREYGCILIGGDTVRSAEKMIITVTMIGEAEAHQVLYRHHARPGDTIWVSGYLGLAAAGLELCRTGEFRRFDDRFMSLVEAHLNPCPRVDAGILLARSGLVHSMMDLSDGLATDLAHLCEASGAGALVEADTIPVEPSLAEAVRLFNMDRVQLMIMGGEDYELLFTAPPANTQRVLRLAEKAGMIFFPVGTITEETGVRLLQSVPGRSDVRETDITFMGYDHFSLNET